MILFLLFLIVGVPSNSFGVGFDFSSKPCKDFLDKIVSTIKVIDHSPGLEKASVEEQIEIKNRIARYSWVKEQTNQLVVFSNSYIRMAEEIGRRYEEQKKHEFTQIANEIFAREGGPSSVILGPITQLSPKQVAAAAEAIRTAAALTTVRYRFLKILIGKVPYSRTLSQSRASDRREAYESATKDFIPTTSGLPPSEKRQLANESLRAVEFGETMANDLEVPSFHRSQLAAHLRFMQDFQLERDSLFTMYVDEVLALVEAIRAR